MMEDELARRTSDWSGIEADVLSAEDHAAAWSFAARSRDSNRSRTR